VCAVPFSLFWYLFVEHPGFIVDPTVPKITMQRYRKPSSKRVIVRRGSRFAIKRSYASFLRGGMSRFARTFASPFNAIQQMRLMQDAVIYLDVAGSNLTINNGATNTPWLVASGAAADIGNGAIATYQFGGALQVNGLSDLIAVANYTNLFNEYQIDRVDFTWTLINGNSANAAGGGGQGAPLPTVYWASDPNDSTIPPTWQTVAEFGSCRHQVLTNEKPIHFTGVPRVAQQLYTSALQTSYGYPARNQQLWIDMANPSFATPHYFGKFWVRNMGGSNSGTTIRIQPKLYFSVRRTN